MLVGWERRERKKKREKDRVSEREKGERGRERE
jgi:hypothetical protein